jgi:hypothetical protein
MDRLAGPGASYRDEDELLAEHEDAKKAALASFDEVRVVFPFSWMEGQIQQRIIMYSTVFLNLNGA